MFKTKKQILTLNVLIVFFLLTFFGLSIRKGDFYIKLESDIQSIQNQNIDYIDYVDLDEVREKDISYIIYKTSQDDNCVTPWGLEIQNGESVIAYQQRQDVNSLCDIERRICKNGKLSGTFKQKSCLENLNYEYIKQEVICYNCKPDNPYIQPEKIAPNRWEDFSKYGRVNQPLVQITKRNNAIKTENIGEEQEIGQNIISKQNCFAPWGENVKHGFFVKAYKSNQGFVNSPCVVEIRHCTDGILNGVYENQYCNYYDMTYEDYQQTLLLCQQGNCDIPTRAVNCQGLPNKAERNYVSQITQIFYNNKRIPSNIGQFDVSVSDVECRFKCSDGYRRDGKECVSSTNLVNCEGLLSNAKRNSVSKITQTRYQNQRLPSNISVYNLISSSDYCRFICENGYKRNGNKCISVLEPDEEDEEDEQEDEDEEELQENQRIINCVGLPANARRNSVSKIVQTYLNNQRTPSNIGQYRTRPSRTECKFACNDRHRRNGSACVSNDGTNPTNDGFQISVIEQIIEGGDDINNQKCGTFDTCGPDEYRPYNGRVQINQYEKPGEDDTCRYWLLENFHIIRRRRQKNITECQKTFIVQEGDFCGSACIYEKDQECLQNATKKIDSNGHCIEI